MSKRRSALLCLAVLLSSCGPGRNEFAPSCPAPKLITPLADLTRYSASGRHDVIDLVVQARIESINGTCKAGDNPSTVAATVRIGLSVLRGPAMQGRDVDLPVFLAVTLGNDVEDKRIFQVRVTFPPNVDRVPLQSPPIELAIPVSGNVTGASYGVIAGFQLTPDELEANRADRGPKL